MNTASTDKAGHVSPDDVLPSRFELYYGGEWHAPRAGRYVDTIDPDPDRDIAVATPMRRIPSAIVAAQNVRPWSRSSARTAGIC